MRLNAALLALTICSAAAAHAKPQYRVTPLPIPPGTGYGRAQAINDAGQIVGWAASLDPFVVYSLFYDGENAIQIPSYAVRINNQGQVAAGSRVWSEAGIVELPAFPGDFPEGAFAIGLNDSGDVVGRSTGADADRLYTTRAVLWRNGTVIDLGTFGAIRRDDAANAINNRGQIVGCSADATGRLRAFLWEDGLMRELPTPEGSSSSAADINYRGQIIGQYFLPTNGESYAVLWQDGGMIQLPSLPGRVAYPDAINHNGQIVGGMVDPATGSSVAVLWENEGLWDLNMLIPADSGWELIWAEDINAGGQIVGMGSLDGQQRDFLLTPVSVPEPAQLISLLAGGFFMLHRQRRGRRKAEDGR